MPRLSCSASTCSYNSSDSCCKNQIAVGGEDAHRVAGTCCESFVESNGAFTNSAQSPNTYLSVNCEAKNCVHNCNSNCQAESIAVSGVSASTSQQTACASFLCE